MCLVKSSYLIKRQGISCNIKIPLIKKVVVLMNSNEKKSVRLDENIKVFTKTLVLLCVFIT